MKLNNVDKMIRTVLNEHYGELLYHDGKLFEVRIVYDIADFVPKLLVSLCKRNQKDCNILNRIKAFVIRGFIPLISIASFEKDRKLCVSAVENAKRGVYSFARKNGDTLAVLLVAVGNLVKKQGLFYCPDIGCLKDRIPLIEIDKDKRVERFYEENFKLIG